MKDSTLRMCWYLAILLTWSSISIAYPELYVLAVGGILFLAYCTIIGIGAAIIASRTLDAIFPRT